MPIVSSDILFKYSVTSGSAGNTVAGTAAGSLGRYISTTVITTAVLDNLFDDVSGEENASSDVEYRCLFVHNSHATLTLQNAVAWITSQVAGGTSLAIAIDDIGAVPIGQAGAQAALIADEGTAPTGVSAFSAPASKPFALALGDIGPGECAAIWVRRTAANTPALDSDGAQLRVEGDTAV